MRALRTIEKVGGLDKYVLKFSKEKMNSDLGSVIDVVFLIYRK